MDSNNNYLRYYMSVKPTWRSRNDIDPEVLGILEALYYHYTTNNMSREEEAEYSDIIHDVMECKTINDIRLIDMKDYFKSVIDNYFELFNKIISIQVTYRNDD